MNALPAGLDQQDSGVSIAPRIARVVHAGIAAALCLAIAIGMPVDMLQRVADGKRGVSMGAVVGIAAFFGLLALAMVLLAVRLARRAWVVDHAGVHKLNWRRADVAWTDVTGVELKRNGRYWQVWVHAPGAVRVAGRDRPRDRLILGCALLAPRPADLHAFVYAQWQQQLHRADQG